ncbi:Fpg/Nei family DNA glycosylase [Streptomyces zingiberis]|uniref:Fpg/Nei family DNA glycosylase n=1 Tax=Streptomyces zingiberis TaxID=2053010 RepID=A0ABX1BZS8_9ACTN|nr:Fpg/Nei family DNA glycosylase [Streptomyces zingiberis]NJQ02633.1 Fpg/Nei family DNA glycosylase [Streptomyces zingiberis]
MPELPEVEVLARFLGDRLTGRRIRQVRPAAVNVLKTYDPPLTALEGLLVTGVRRYGKFTAVTADGSAGSQGPLHLVFHLARAGRVRWHRTAPAAPSRPGYGPLALRVRLEPADGPGAAGGAAPDGGSAAGFDLTESGSRKALAVSCVRDPAQVPGIARLGPEPLGETFTVEVFTGLLRGERRRIKGVLRDQSVVAGIGNAYSDEILHAARLSPYLLAADLGEERAAELYRVARHTLREAVERLSGVEPARLADAARSGLRVHGRTGEPCPVCGDTVRGVSFAGSSLQYCPTCQTGGRTLSDRRMSRLLK